MTAPCSPDGVIEGRHTAISLSPILQSFAVTMLDVGLERPAPVATLASAQRDPGATDRLVPMQFVLDAPRASRVSLVGDFNAWDAADTPLMRDPASGIWTVTVALVPG